MARIRTIKPEHWQEEEWSTVSLQSHLLWIGMKNFADDKGIIRSNAVLIKSNVFPCREDIRTADVQKWLTELVQNSFLIPLTYEDKGYYSMDFSEERIDKPQPGILPKNFDYNSIREHSRTFENTPAVEERRGEEEESKGITPDGPFEIAFNGFIEMRKKIRKPATDYAIQLILKQLEKLSNGDLDLKIKILEQSILNGWQDVFPLKTDYSTKKTDTPKENKIEKAENRHLNFMQKITSNG